MKVLLWSIFLPILVSGQVLDNREGNAFTDKPFFNTSFVRNNHLKKLEGYYVYKKKNDVMRDTDFKCAYNFDENGHLISSYETRPDDGSLDTTWNFYEYSDDHLLKVHRKTEQQGFTSTHYAYDEQQRVIEESYTRDYADSSGKVVARSLSFNSEKFTYQDFGNQLKRTRYNSDNLPYLEEITNYSGEGYLVERTERIKMTNTVYTYSYEYNERGKLSAIRKKSNQQEEYLEEFTFNYDELGNLIEKHIYRNGEFTTDIQIIYNSKSKLIASVITRQVSTGFLTIVRFKTYEFYD